MLMENLLTLTENAHTVITVKKKGEWNGTNAQPAMVLAKLNILVQPVMALEL